MKIYTKISFIFLILVGSTITLFSQNWKTVPEAFDGQCKQSFLDDIYTGVISLNSLPSKTDRIWTVYSDRENNRLKNRARG